jgi:transitional endoplasmic reticulum ATPase
MREDINAKNVKQSHFLPSIEDTGPSVTPETMDYYEKLKGELRKKRSKQIETRPEMYA